MLRFVISLLVLIAFSAWSGESQVYRWVTEDGQIIFSDQPVPGAKPIDLTAKVQNVAESVKPAQQPQLTPPQVAKPIALTFLGLEDQATIRSATGELTVTAAIDIQIGVTQTFQLLLDGTPTGQPQSSMQFNLSDIDRGEHTLQLRLLNTIGDVLSQSERITFYMHRPSVQTRP